AMFLFSYVSARHPTREYTTAQKRPFERSFAVDAAAAEARGFADCVKPRNRLAVAGAEDTALKVGLDSSQAFSRQNELTDGNQRRSLRIENSLEVRGADAVAAISAEIGDAAQLVVIVVRRPARDHFVPVADGRFHHRAVESQAVEIFLVHALHQLAERVRGHDIVNALVDQTLNQVPVAEHHIARKF